MSNVHFVLQGKGGVGKSVVSALLAQYLSGKGVDVLCIDTDPTNATLEGFASLNAKRIELMDGGTLVERNFDSMMEMIFAAEGDTVIDNGASSFIPLSHYLLENEAFEMIKEHGHRVCVHTVVTGGASLDDTLLGFRALAQQVSPYADLYVWINDALARVERDGKRFEDMRVYAENKDAITGVIRLDAHTQSTFGEDMKNMLERKFTFDDVKQAASFNVMSKQRLATIRRRIFESIEAAGL